MSSDKFSSERWPASRKVAVIQSLSLGVMSFDDAIKTYRLSVDELLSWVKAYNTKKHFSALTVKNLAFEGRVCHDAASHEGA